MPPFLYWSRAPLHLTCRCLLKPASLTGLRVSRVISRVARSHYLVWAISWGYTWAGDPEAKDFSPGSGHWTRQSNARGGCPKWCEIMRLLIRCILYRLLTLNSCTNEAISLQSSGRHGLCRAPPSAEKYCGLNPYSSSLCVFCSFSKASFLSAKGRTPETSQINRIVQKQATNGSGTSIILIISARY